MAKANTNASALLLNLLPSLFLLLIIIAAAASTAESRLIFGIGFGDQSSAPICDEVYGAEKGDSCFTVTKKFKLTSEFFSALNPNLNCTDIFINQWLCVDGYVN